MNYYNEFDPYAAEWLRNLIAAGLIPDGVVDERSIEDVTPADLRGFTQCHFFAGIAGWSLALEIAGVPSGTPLWTGSCPCQPFSTAGRQAGFDDERHLWPAWHWLIQECRPAAVFGEQVASKVAEPWLDLVSTDLEGLGYAFGAVAFPSASVGSPHIRDRAWWVAHTDDERLERRQREQQRAAQRPAGPGGVVIRLADTADQRRIGQGTGETRSGPEAIQQSQRFRDARGLANSDCIGRAGNEGSERGVFAGANQSVSDGSGPVRPGPTNGFWRDADWISCRDEKWRPVEPGTFPLAHGVPGRVGRLRAYGNAINVYQAAEFIRSAL